MDYEELIGIFEIAEMAKVRSSAVANWRKRNPDFPKPVADPRSGPVFRKRDIRVWLERRSKHMVPTQESPTPKPLNLDEAVEFAVNPEPRCACVLLLDTSGSMQGEKIAALN